MQFIKLDLDILKNNDLNVTDKLIYSILCDRMDSSRKRPEFYDSDQQDYYAIYTIEEMSKLLGLSKTPVVNSYKRLSNLGYLTKIKLFNSATRLFLPKYEIPQSSTPKFHNQESNHINSNQTDTTRDTKDTREVNVLTQSLINKLGLSERSANMFKSLSFNSYDTLHYYVSILLKAKNSVYKAHMNVKGITLGTRFETNTELNYKLPKTIQQIIVSANRKAKNKGGYIYKAFYAFFEEQVDSYLQSKRKKTSSPIIESLV